LASDIYGRRHISIAFIMLTLTAAIVLLYPYGVLHPAYLMLIRQGDEHARRFERTAAAALYGQAAAIRPHDPQAYLHAARLYLEWGRQEETQAAITQAAQAGAAQSEVEQLWIALYISQAEWPGVSAHARQLLARQPDDTTARHALAWALLEMRDWEAARREYETILRLDPGDTVAHERLGILLAGEDNRLARQHLSLADTGLAKQITAILDGEKTAEAAYVAVLLGRVLIEHEEWALSACQLSRAVTLHPYYADAHVYLGYALSRMGYPEMASYHLARGVELAPASPAAHILLGLHYKHLGNLSSARAEYEQAYDLDPRNPATCAELGLAWAAEGRYTEAEIWLRQATSLAPQDPRLWEILARFYLDYNLIGDEGIADVLARLLTLAPGEAWVYELQGRAALQAGKYEAARESLLKAVDLDPLLASAHYYLGLVYKAMGLREQALGSFRRASDLDTSGALRPLIERASGGWQPLRITPLPAGQ